MRFALATALLVVACGGRPAPPMKPTEPSPAASESLTREIEHAAAGVADARLAAVLREHWGWILEDQPTRATRLGVHDYDDRISERSAAANDARRARRRDLLERVKAIAGEGLSPGDTLTRSLLLDQLGAEIGVDVCRFEEWTVDARSNPVTEWNELPELHPLES